MSKKSFKDRANDVMDTSDVRITLWSESPDTIMVQVAEKTAKHGVVRQSCEIHAEKFTPGVLMGAAETLRGLIRTSVAMIAASTPGFEKPDEA